MGEADAPAVRRLLRSGIRVKARVGGALRPSVVHLMGWHSQQYGSFERFLVALSHRCREAGADTHLVFPGLPPSAGFRADVDASIHHVALASHPGDIRMMRDLHGLLRRVDASHVHVHFGLDAYMGLLAARAAGVTQRFATKHATPGMSRLTLSRTRHRWLASQVRTFFTVSHQVRNDLVALGVPPSNLEVAYLGVDVRTYRPDPARRSRARAQLGLGPHERLVLCTSHLRPGKGVEMLPGLASDLVDMPIPVSVLVAGDGPLRPSLEGEAQALGLTPDRFRILGVREDIPELLAAADLYVFPTTGNEGLPLAPIEALASGVPVLTTGVSDLGGLLQDGAARLLRPGDSAALATACRDLLLDPAGARALGQRGRALAVGRLDVGAGVEQHVTRYFTGGQRKHD